MIKEISADRLSNTHAEEFVKKISKRSRKRPKSTQGVYQNIMSGSSTNLHQSVSNCYKHCEACQKILLNQQVEFVKQK